MIPSVMHCPVCKCTEIEIEVEFLPTIIPNIPNALIERKIYFRIKDNDVIDIFIEYMPFSQYRIPIIIKDRKKGGY